MAFELKDGNGSLFKNERRDRDNSPEYTGTIKIGGNEYYLNAWVKEGNKGKFFSLSVKPKTITAHNGEVYDKKDVEAHIRSSKRNVDQDVPW